MRAALFAAAMIALGSTTTTMADDAEKLADVVLGFGQTKMTGELMDSPPSRDLLAQLPVTIPVSRLLDREYAGQWALTTEGLRQQGYDDGTIGYCAPGGYFAVFFDKGETADIRDLIVMGKVPSNLSVFKDMAHGISLTIERVNDSDREG
jgi:hypothetical protein